MRARAIGRVLTLGELRAATADLDDDVRVLLGVEPDDGGELELSATAVEARPLEVVIS